MMPEPPWWDKIIPLIIFIKLAYHSIPIIVLVFVIAIYKNVKKIVQNTPNNEGDKE